MNLSLLDVALVAFLALLTPLLAVWMHRHLTARVEAGDPQARIHGYARILVLEWTLFAVALVLWFSQGRSGESLGLGLPTGLRWWIGVGLAAAVCVLLVVQWLSLRGNEEKLRESVPEFESLRAMLPHDNREQGWFRAVSISAGICEEIVYRGFLLQVLAAVMGMWVAVPLSSLIFGLAHSYQGPKGIVKTGAIGLIMAGFTVLTGSLWAAMLVHTVIDITSGLIARRVVTLPGAPVGQPGTPAPETL